MTELVSGKSEHFNPVTETSDSDASLAQLSVRPGGAGGDWTGERNVVLCYL